MAKLHTIVKLLQSQGFGTRRECEQLVANQAITWNKQLIHYIDDSFEPLLGTPFTVHNESHIYRPKAYIVLHKPSGYECSQAPKEYPSVYTLLPTYLRQRGESGSRSGVQCVGRLDQDTTGLLLLSDDGTFIHHYTSPKKQLNKCYLVETKHAITEEFVKKLQNGVILNGAMGDTPEPVYAKTVEVVGVCHLKLTITEGRYHQVKRMVAAASNRCQSLHRLSVGNYQLPADLPEGQWQYVEKI